MWIVTESPDFPGMMFVLVGPAGAGKNTLMKAVVARKEGLRQIPTATTREIREGEQQGREHLFVTRPEFEEMWREGKLLESQNVHGNLYGMVKEYVERALADNESVIADIEMYGAALAARLYPDNVVSVFISPPSVHSLIERMTLRKEEPAEISRRMLRVPLEMAYAAKCDYIILNNELDAAADTLHAIVVAERARRSTRRARLSAESSFGLQYVVEVIPVYQDEALVRTSEPTIPSALLPFDQDTIAMPNVTALELLGASLGFDPQAEQLIGGDGPNGEFLPPVALMCGRSIQGEEIRYRYLYRLNERIIAPAGWTWVSLSDVELQVPASN